MRFLCEAESQKPCRLMETCSREACRIRNLTMHPDSRVPKPASVARLTAIARMLPDIRRLIAYLVASCLLCSLAGCAPVSTPTPTPAMATRAAPSPTSTPIVPTPTIPSPTATPTPEPANRRDAFEVQYFPWAGSPNLPAYTGEGRAKVFNSIFFAAPPFFAFDINPPEGWYHVVGAEEYVTLDGQPISPTIDSQWQPRDGDRVLLHGHVQGQSAVASYVGVSGGAPYYYRSLLSAEELQQDSLPTAYDGLFVWVRGELDVNTGAGLFYELPADASFDASYVGRDAILAGRLSLGDRTVLHVTGSIYVKEHGADASIFDGSAWASTWAASHRGTVVELDPPLRQLLLVRGDGAVIQVSLDADTAVHFADGSTAPPQALSLGQAIQVTGQASADTEILAKTVTIIAVVPAGQPYAVYVRGADSGLWSIGLDDLEPRLLLPARQALAVCSLEDARLSPDGRAVVLGCADGQSTYLVTADLQSGEWRQWLTDDAWNETHPAWSPDTQRIVCCRHQVRDGQVVDAGLWVLGLRDGQVRQIADAATEGLQTVAPQWSPDGRHIAYARVGTTGEQLAILYVLTFPGQEQEIVDEVRDWAWSPDATQLLVTRQSGEQSRSRLWIVQRDGTSLTWLSITGVHDQEGHWSPDGRHIAFLSRPWPSSGLDRLCIMQADGMRRIQPREQPFASSLAWAGDGGSILFIRLNEQRQPAGLWTVTPDGSGLNRLVQDAAALIGSYQAP